MSSFSTGRGFRRGVVIEGDQETLKQFAALQAAVKGHSILKAVEEGAEELESAMKFAAPIDTGEMVNEIATTSRMINPNRAESRTGFQTYHYGVHVELGTEDTPPRSFMRWALTYKASVIRDTIAKAFKSRIEAVTRGSR